MTIHARRGRPPTLKQVWRAEVAAERRENPPELAPVEQQGALETLAGIRDEMLALRAENRALKEGISHITPIVIADWELASMVKRQQKREAEKAPQTETAKRAQADYRRRAILRGMTVNDIRKILRTAYGDNYYWDHIGSRGFVLANWDKLEYAVIEWIRGRGFMARGYVHSWLRLPLAAEQRPPPTAKPHIHLSSGVWIARIGNLGGVYAPTIRELGEFWLLLRCPSLHDKLAAP